MPVHNQQNKYTKKQSDLAALKQFACGTQLFGAGSAGCDKELFSSMQATTICVCVCVFVFDTLCSIPSTKNKNVLFLSKLNYYTSFSTVKHETVLPSKLFIFISRLDIYLISQTFNSQIQMIFA